MYESKVWFSPSNNRGKSRKRETLNLMKYADSSTDTIKSEIKGSNVKCLVSHVTCHLTTTLFSFSCYERPSKFGNADAGFVMEKV